MSQIVRAAPLDEAGNVRGQRVGIGPNEQVDVIRLNRQADNLPAMLSHHLVDDLLQPVSHRPYQHLPAPFGAPDDVVDHQVNILSLVLIVHGNSILPGNTERKARGAIHPLAQTEGLYGPFL